MPHHPRAMRSTGSFRVVDGRILLSRLGPVSARKQHHNHSARDMVTGLRVPREEGEGPYEAANPTPESRGYWAFPYPFGEAFFFNHVYARHLPKRLSMAALVSNDLDQVARNVLWEERQACFAEIRERVKIRLIWHAGPFYAQVPPRGACEPKTWWLYDNAREYVEEARRTFTRHIDRNHVCMNYPTDHMQIFVPAGGAKAGRSSKCRALPLSCNNDFLEQDEDF